MNLTIEELEQVIKACERLQMDYDSLGWYEFTLPLKTAYQKLLDQLADTIDQRYSD